MEKLTKQDLKGPDMFVSNMSKLTDRAYQHRTLIISVLATILIIGIGWSAYGVYSGNQEEKAQEALFGAQKKLRDIEENFAKKNVPAKAVAKPTGNLENDYKDALGDLRNLVKEYPRTQAAVIASLELSRLYYAHKKYDEGIPLLENAVKRAVHPVTKGFALDHLGMAYEGKGDCNTAIQNWEKIEKDKELAFLHGNSLIKTALCHEKLKQFDKAEQTYRRAEGLTHDSQSARTAKKYLRLLKRSQS